MTFALVALGITFVLVVCGLAVATYVGSKRIEQRYPATGLVQPTPSAPIHLVQWGVADASLPSLIFLHGASSNHREFMIALGEELEAERSAPHHCVFVDRPGQGHSPRRSGDHSPRVQADRIVQAAQALGVQRAVIIGHSWGTSVAAQIALNHKAFCQGVLFVAPATHPWVGGGWGGVTWYYGVACLPLIGTLFTRLITLPVGWFRIDEGVETVFAPEAPRPGYPKRLGARLVLRPRAFAANAEDVFRLRPFVTREAPNYPNITCPVHILTGDQDGVVWPHVHSDGLERDIQAAQKHVVRGAGHMPHHTHPETTHALIKDLLARAQTGKSVRR